MSLHLGPLLIQNTVTFSKNCILPKTQNLGASSLSNFLPPSLLIKTVFPPVNAIEALWVFFLKA